MDVKEAVRTAKYYLQELLADEDIMDIGLEEVTFDRQSNCWMITLGFSRPWERQRTIADALRDRVLSRSYKVIRVSDETGNVESLIDRILKSPA